MKTVLVALVLLIPFTVKANQTSQRVPVAPGQAIPLRLGAGGVPPGFMIVGETKTAPPGFSFAGLSLTADPTSAVWRTAPPLLTSRTELGAAVVDGKIYAIGGCGGAYTGAVEEYDPAFDAWTPRAPMPTPRSRMAVVTVGDKIYAIGGENGSYLGTTEEYTPATNSWSTRAPMPTARTMLAAAVIHGRIYAIGGSAVVGVPLSTVEEFDPAKNSWTPKQPMPIARGRLAVVELDGKAFAMGGSNTPLPVEVYDPIAGVWTEQTKWSAGYDWPGVVMYGRIYGFGGYPQSKLRPRVRSRRGRLEGADLPSDAQVVTRGCQPGRLDLHDWRLNSRRRAR